MKTSSKILWGAAAFCAILTIFGVIALRLAMNPREAEPTVTFGSSQETHDDNDAQEVGSYLMCAPGVVGAEGPELAPGASRSLDLSGFSRLNLSGSWNVRLVQGMAWAVRVTAPRDRNKEIRIDLQGDTLEVKLNDRRHAERYTGDAGGLEITLPVLASLQSAGSLNVDLKDLAADRLDLNLAGSGRVGLAGKAASLRLGTSGSWEVDGADLSAQEVDVQMSGSGHALLKGSGARIQGQISGAITLELKGQPVSSSVDASGISRVDIR